MKNLPIERFLADVSQHELTILREDGLYRHLRFKRPNSGEYRFDLITWPGHLCYTGDMGTFVFSRVTDMFEFFRPSERWKLVRGRDHEERPYDIDFAYWAEKALAVDKSGIDRWEPETFRADVKEYFDGVVDDTDSWPKKRAGHLWAAICEEVLSRVDEGEWVARTALEEFSFNDDPGAFGRTRYAFRFADWERTSREWSHCFVWCCYALRWGIERYDAAQADRLLALAECKHELARDEDRFCCACGTAREVQP